MLLKSQETLLLKKSPWVQVGDTISNDKCFVGSLVRDYHCLPSSTFQVMNLKFTKEYIFDGNSSSFFHDFFQNETLNSERHNFSHWNLNILLVLPKLQTTFRNQCRREEKLFCPQYNTDTLSLYLEGRVIAVIGYLFLGHNFYDYTFPIPHVVQASHLVK